MSPVSPCLLSFAAEAGSLVAMRDMNTSPIQLTLQQEQCNGGN